jgi:hypothetical protein
MIFRSRQKPEASSRDAIHDTLAQRAGVPQPTAPGTSASQAAPSKGRPPSRKTRQSMTVWQEADAIKQLRLLAAEEGKSQQELVAEALNLLFSKYGKQPIA